MKSSSIAVIALASTLILGCGVNPKFESAQSKTLTSTTPVDPTSNNGPDASGVSSSPNVPATPSGEDCSASQYRLYSTWSGSAPANYYFGIYTVWGGTMNVDIAYSHAPESVDLYLQAYDPTTWSITGNVAAVRSVRVTGYGNAYVNGVPSYKVSLSTYTQTGSGYTGYTNGNANVPFRKFQQTYEGYCVAPFTAD